MTTILPPALAYSPNPSSVGIPIERSEDIAV
jgi:hypothetical protein